MDRASLDVAVAVCQLWFDAGLETLPPPRPLDTLTQELVTALPPNHWLKLMLHFTPYGAFYLCQEMPGVLADAAALGLLKWNGRETYRLEVHRATLAALMVNVEQRHPLVGSAVVEETVG